MTNNQGRTDREILESLSKLFLETESDEAKDVDAELRELGHDPDTIGARMQALAERALAQSPMNWRNRSADLDADRSRLDELSATVTRTREEIIAAINSIQDRLSGSIPAGALYRNLEEISDEDLASHLAELEYMAEQQKDGPQ